MLNSSVGGSFKASLRSPKWVRMVTTVHLSCMLCVIARKKAYLCWRRPRRSASVRSARSLSGSASTQHEAQQDCTSVSREAVHRRPWDVPRRKSRRRSLRSSKKSEALGRGTHRTRKREAAEAIQALSAEHSLNDLLRISGLRRSSYYYHRHRFREDKYSELAQAIRTLFAQHKGRYGYRRITCALRQSGYAVNHKTVLKLMRREGLKCQVRRVRYRPYKGQVGRIAPNLLQRKFAATAPNQKWATDVTEFAVGGQKLYLSSIIDLYGEVVSYALARHPRFEMIIRMLEKAFPRLEDNTALLLHSDQGWPYQMGHYQNCWKRKESDKACHERETVWTMQWPKTSFQY